jgi:hypothetical protein
MNSPDDQIRGSLPKMLFAGSGGNVPTAYQWQWPGHDAKAVCTFPKGHSIYSLAISPGAQFCAIGCRTGLVRIFSLSDGLVPLGTSSCYEFFHRDMTPVMGVNFCVDDHVVTGGQDGTIRIWSISNRRQLADFQAHPEGVVALQPLGPMFLATIGREGILKIWDLDSLNCCFTSSPFQLPKAYALTSLVYSSAGGHIFHPTGIGELLIYDGVNQLANRSLKAHDGDFCAVAASPRYLATAGMEDRRIRIWSLNPDRALYETEAEGPVASLAWISEDEFVAVYSNGSARIWRLNGHLSKGISISNLNLRTCAGLSEFTMTKHIIRERHDWHLEQLRRGQELLRDLSPASEAELFQIIAELEAKGFRSEAMIFRTGLVGMKGAKAEYLSMFNQLITTLKKEKANDPRPQLAPLYGALDLLLSLDEPAAAMEFAERIRKIDPGYLDTPKRYEDCRSHPLLHQSEERILRADLRKPESITDQIEVANVLDKRFCWNLLIYRYDPLMISDELSWITFVQKARTIDGGWRPLQLPTWNGHRIHDGQWLAKPVGRIAGLKLAVEVILRDKETQLIPCMLFCPSENSESAEDTKSFNRALAETIHQIERPEEATIHRWLAPLLETIRARDEEYRF